MDYQVLVQDVLETAVTIILPFVGAYAVNWLKVHIGEKRTNIILNDVRTVVQSVQQMADSGQIDKSNKFYTAFDYIAHHYKDLPGDKITHLIESAVKNMKDWGPSQLLPATSVESVNLDTVNPTPATTVAPPVVNSNATI